MLSGRSLFLLVMKTMTMEVIIAMMAIFWIHQCDGAALSLRPEEQIDASNSGMHPAISGFDQITAFLRVQESSELNDIASGYPSGSSGDNLPWTYRGPNSPVVKEERARPAVSHQTEAHFQSGDSFVKDHTGFPPAKTETFSGDLLAKLPFEEELTVSDTETVSSVTKETSFPWVKVQSTRGVLSGLLSLQDVFSSSGAKMASSSSPDLNVGVELFTGDDDLLEVKRDEPSSSGAQETEVTVRDTDRSVSDEASSLSVAAKTTELTSPDLFASPTETQEDRGPVFSNPPNVISVEKTETSETGRAFTTVESSTAQERSAPVSSFSQRIAAEEFHTTPVSSFSQRTAAEEFDTTQVSSFSQRTAAEEFDTTQASSFIERNTAEEFDTARVSPFSQRTAAEEFDTTPTSSFSERTVAEGFDTTPASSFSERTAAEESDTMPASSFSERTAAEQFDTTPASSFSERTAAEEFDTTPASSFSEWTAAEEFDTTPASSFSQRTAAKDVRTPTLISESVRFKTTPPETTKLPQSPEPVSEAGTKPVDTELCYTPEKNTAHETSPRNRETSSEGNDTFSYQSDSGVAKQDGSTSSDRQLLTTSSSSDKKISDLTNAETERFVTTADKVFTVPIETSSNTKAETSASKMISDDFYVSGISRTRRQTGFTVVETFPGVTTAEFSSTTPRRADSTTAMPSTLTPTLTTATSNDPTTTTTTTTTRTTTNTTAASAATATGSATTSTPLPTHTSLATTDSKAARLGSACQSDESCSRLKESRCLQGICSCRPDYHHDSRNSGCVREPYDLTEESANETCIRLQWSGEDYNYNVTVTSLKYGGEETVSVTRRHHTLCGLTAGSLLNVSVVLVSGGQPASTTITLRPSPPQNGTIEWIESDRFNSCLSLRWSAGSGVWSHFSIRYQDAGQTERNRSTTAPRAVVCGLAPGSRIPFDIFTVSQNTLSEPLVLEGCTEPGPVQDFSVEKKTATSVTLSWKRPAVGSIDYYTIKGNHSSDYITVMNDTDSRTIHGLLPGTEYRFDIMAEFCETSSSSQASITVRTTASTLSLDVTAVGTKLNVTWSTEDHSWPPLAFWLRVVDTGGVVVYERSVRSSPHVVDTGRSGACFNVTLRVMNGILSETKVEATDEAAPWEVTHLHAQRSAVDRRTINVTWSKPAVTNGVVTAYRVHLLGLRNLRSVSRTLTCAQCALDCPGKSRHRARARLPKESGAVEFERNDEDLQLLVDELSEYENYRVEVVAVTGGGHGPSSWLVVVGQLPDAVRNLSLKARNSSCLSLTWDQPANAANQSDILFHVHYRKANVSSDDVSDTTLFTKETCVTVCELDYWTDYRVDVTAEDQQGTGKTATGYCRTAEHVPGRVVNLTVTTEEDIFEPRTLWVRWSEPVHKYGLITNYFVVVRKVGAMELVQQKSVAANSRRSDSNGEYFIESFNLSGDVLYEIQVFAATGAGNGSEVWTSKRMPAGALPRPTERVSLTALPTGSSVGTDRVHLSLPAALLCNRSYGSPVRAGYIVYPASRPGAAAVEGISEGSVPVTMKTYAETAGGSSDMAYFVELPLDDLGRQCSGGDSSIRIVAGRPVWEGCGSGVGGHCGGPLRQNTAYRVQAVMCTSAACTYSLPSLQFRTLAQTVPESGGDSSALAAGLVAVFLLMVIGTPAAVFMYRRRRRVPAPKEPEPPEPAQPLEEICRNSTRPPSQYLAPATQKPVPLDEFIDHVDMLHRDSNLGFSDEYKMIKDLSRDYPTKAAELPACKAKNRYTNILPWDKSRVKLLPTDDEEGSDYINASYLPGQKHQREFIAAQGPLPGTIDDFWRMVWENRVCVMVMLTQCVEKGRTKCEKYWPDEGEREMYGDLVVQVRSQSVLPDYIIRVIDVKLGNQSRMIKHFHFMRWPDHGCPEKTAMLLNFVSSVRAHMPHSGSGPMLVHCSAGVGRTGTFVALDQLLQQIRHVTEVDIFNLVLTMRDHRTQMVQTENQYIYIHDCLADALAKDGESDDDVSHCDDEEHIYGNC